MGFTPRPLVEWGEVTASAFGGTASEVDRLRYRSTPPGEADLADAPLWTDDYSDLLSVVKR